MQEGGCVKLKSMETDSSKFQTRINEREKPRQGPGPIPTGVRARWPWVEPSVWTERMLTALEEGVKGGRWYCLWDKVLEPENAQTSFAKVKAKRGSPGVDHVTVKQFEAGLEKNIDHVIRQLREGKYTGKFYTSKVCPKPGSK